ncbi:hypothetical protein A4X13_0g7288 [Tilletia indica]|uniref:Oxidation resistance protein 1 n=1 Tax=Tilletia indica TaxID=43049 RepID=A0A8T8SKI3_9BASI|nr:hypothetical protein A4X13_0g7288 [Tilletia indica]
MSIPQYSPTTGRFERPAHGNARSQSIDSNSSDFGAFVDATDSSPAPEQQQQLPTTSSLFDSILSESSAGPSQQQQSDQDLFNAFEQAAIEQAQHRPSPPPIDLRSVEDKLGPEVLVPRRTPSHTSQHTATTAGFPSSSSAANSPSITRLDASSELLNPNNNNNNNSSFSFFDLAQLDPHHADPNRPALDPALLEDDPALLKEQLTLKRRQNSLAHARDYSDSGASSSHNHHHRIPPSGPTPIAGAPGFDARAEKNWNTGHWTFDLEHDPVLGSGTTPLSSSVASLRSTNSARASTLPAQGSSSHQHDASAQQGGRRQSAATSPSRTSPSSSHQPPSNWSLSSNSATPSIRRPITVRLTDRHELTSEVILPWHASHLQAALPPRLRLGQTWKLLYSLDQHGMSLATLYNNVAKGLDPSRAPRSSGGGGDFSTGDSYMRGASAAARGAVGLGSGAGVKKLGGGLSITEAGLILAVKDAEDNVFGAFINERLRPRTGYYGTGECFLWKTTRQPPSLKAANPSLEPNRIKTFRWTGRNDYVLLTESTFLSIGSGDNGRYGLWLGSSLEQGVSSRCSTFGNDVLCDDEPGGEEQDGGGELADRMEEERSKGKDPFGLFDQGGVDSDGDEAKFEVMGLEVWAVGID